MKINQIYHEDIAEQEADTIFQELKRVKALIQEIQCDLGRIENVLFELKQMDKQQIECLFNDLHQPIEVRLFYKLAHKYETLQSWQLTPKNILFNYRDLYRLINSNTVNLRAYEDTLVQFYFRGDEE